MNKKITITEKENIMTYTMENKASLNLKKHIEFGDGKTSFMVDDVKSVADSLSLENDIVEITAITSTETGNGYGSKIIQECVKNNEDNIILVKAEPRYASEEKYTEAKTNGEFYKSLDQLDNFYLKNNFRDINNFIQYENSIPYVYKNEPGDKVADYMDKLCAETDGAVNE